MAGNLNKNKKTNKINLYSNKYKDFSDINTINKLLEFARNEYKNKTCLYKGKDNDEPITYEEVYCNVKAIAAFLNKNYNSDKRIALLSENSTELILACLAIMYSGNVAVPLDKSLPEKELLDMIKKCDCSAIFYSDLLKKKTEIITKESCINIFSLSSIFELSSKGEKYQGRILQPHHDDLAAIIFTSGTLGEKKGVMLSHENLVKDAIGACLNVKASDTLILLPIHHSFAWSAAMLPMFIYGVSAHVCSNMHRLIKDLQRYKPQNISAVPLIVENIYQSIWTSAKKTSQRNDLKWALRVSRMLMKLGIDKRKLIFKKVHSFLGGNLDLIICGGAPLEPEIQRTLCDIGIDVVNGYGITECSPIVAVESNNQHKFGSVGKPLPCNQVKIKDPDNNGIGEILIKGDNVMLGYYNDDKATQEAFEQEWFKSGDYGKIDKEEYLYITGRKKNLIVLSNGENVSAEELENQLLRIPYVKEVAVYEKDKAITAEFYLDETEKNAEKKLKEDINSFNKTVPLYKNIQNIKIRQNEFEKTSIMKIKRNLLDADSNREEK